MLDNKRLQDRIDSLEFYTKTNTNSSFFHNLTPTTSSSSNGSSGTRGRTPAPLPTRQRLGTTSSGINYGLTNPSYTNIGSTYGTVNATSTPSYYDSYRSASRPASRQSSVERSLDSYNTNNNSLLNSSSIYGGSTVRLSDLGISKSRQSSPTRSTYEPSSTSSSRSTYEPSSSSSTRSTYEPSSSTTRSTYEPTTSSARSTYEPSSSSSRSTYEPSSSSSRSTYEPSSSSTRSTYEPSSSTSERWTSSRPSSTLPPQYPSLYDGYATIGRNRRETSTERASVQLRARREASQDRALGSRPSISSTLLKLRRSSFVDNSSSSGLSKYY